VPGAVLIVVALLLFPVIALMGLTVIAAGLGSLLDRDARDRNEGSELIDVNY
jgi:hypothetical protein